MNNYYIGIYYKLKLHVMEQSTVFFLRRRHIHIFVLKIARLYFKFYEVSKIVKYITS